jgi:hypothetical protein
MSVIARKFLWRLVAVWNEVVAVLFGQRERFGPNFFMGLFSLIEVRWDFWT